MRSIVCFVLIFMAGTVVAEYEPSIRFARFRGDARAAVSLTFDDALPSHLDRAVPILNRYGLHATFFIFTDNVKSDAVWQRWRDAARDEHELGCHSKSHPPLSALNNPRRMQIEINGSGELIEKKTGVRPLAFAYPFSDVDDRVRRRVRESYFVDRDSCRIWGGVAFSAADGVAAIKQAVARREWFFCMMHGVDDRSFKSVSAEALDGIASYLADHRGEIWTECYSRVALYQKACRVVQLRLKNVRQDGFSLKLKIPEKTPYREYMTQPLTLKIGRAPHSAAYTIKAYDGDELLNVTVSHDGKYFLLDVIPDGGWIDVFRLKI